MNTDTSQEAVLGPCHICTRDFLFDIDTVPSVLIDPVTDAPADAPGSNPARGVRRPLCPPCARRVNNYARTHNIDTLVPDPTDQEIANRMWEARIH